MPTHWKEKMSFSYRKEMMSFVDASEGENVSQADISKKFGEFVDRVEKLSCYEK